MKKQIRNIILMLALCLGMSGMTALAANDKMEYRDHLYQRFDTGMTWTAAKEYCKKLGGHLVVITSASEQNKVQSLIAKGTQKQYWLGAKRDMNKRNFVWVNGAKFAYANWSKGEPNNYRSEEGYVQMYRVPNPHNYSADSFGKWNDINNENHIYDEEDFFTTDQVGFICEFDKGWKKISPAKVTLSTKTYTYSGNQKKPAVTVKMGRTKLVKGKDYKVSYRSNTKPGKANVTITGIGKYKGTKTVHFTIKPRRVQSLSVKSGKSKSAAVSWKARREADGYEVQYCRSKSFRNPVTFVIDAKGTVAGKKTDQTVNAVGRSKTKIAISELTAKKRYYVRVRAFSVNGNETVYGKWTAGRSVKIRK